jgi:7-carboxy-7-deazaguanine synthase
MMPLSSTPAPQTLENYSQPRNMIRTAPIQEIFSSTQGEGVYVGKRQIFVRFAHCHLKCAYCDTPMTSATGQCHVETLPGSGEIVLHPNPLHPDMLVLLTKELWSQARHHSISLTGGEPLLYHAFLRDVLPLIRPFAPLYLETSGTQPEFLEVILDWIDIVAMDIKLPSSTKEFPRYEAHAAFYQLARQKECFIKVVFNAETNQDELDAIRDIVTDRFTPIILQPETSLQDRNVHIAPHELFRVENTLSQWFKDVRIIPQTHKMLNVL